MGVYREIYIGPYLRIPQIDNTITHEHKKCMTEGCVSYKNYLKEKFCPNCGNKAILFPVIQKVKSRAFKLSLNEENKWHNTFVFPHNGGCYIEDGYDYLLPNSYKDLVGITKIGDKFVGGVDILNVDIQDIKEKFIAKYGKYIDKIKADGGEPEICYGIFIHYD